ncbi:MAG: hypothetical protein IJI42_00155 [Methanobrevibacter sp.]|nr:hypothetical protein [Methanobrevibacter sp.]
MEFKGMDEVDEHELKLMALRCFLIGLFGSFVVSAIMYLLMKNIIYAEITFVGSFLGSAYFAFIILKRDWLDKKIGLFDPDLPGFSYQCMVVFLCFPSIVLSFTFFAMAWGMGGIYSGIAHGLCVNFASIFMLLKLDVYNNKSRLIYLDENEGGKYFERIFGYNPLIYYFLGIQHGLGPLGMSFRRVLECIFLHNGSLVYNLLCFILCLLAGCFILSPDIANNLFPFEIRTFEGSIKFIAIGFLLMIICIIPLI